MNETLKSSEIAGDIYIADEQPHHNSFAPVAKRS